jgi:hypothetical protein
MRNSFDSPTVQDQPVERDEPDPVIAFAGQPALAAQLDQHGLAVGAILRNGEPSVDPAAVGRRREEQQIERLDRESGGERDEQPDQIDRIEIELEEVGHGGYPSFRSSPRMRGPGPVSRLRGNERV